MTWTKEAEAYLTEAMGRGVTQRQIAIDLGTTHAAVRGRARVLGVYADKPSKISAHLDTPEAWAINAERLRDAVIGSIARYANDNGMDIDTAARRLLSGVEA